MRYQHQGLNIQNHVLYISILRIVSQILYKFRYMKRRCQFLENFPAFIYNTGVGEYTDSRHGRRMSTPTIEGERLATNTRMLGSTLMNAMLKEVSDFCDPEIKENWSAKAHQQVSLVRIYRYSFSLYHDTVKSHAVD